jgi:cytidyltransferase-like protein
MIYSYKDLPRLRKGLRNKKTVFVSGCFDIVHEGHLQFLEKAATYGDALVVGVLSDTYIRTHKKRAPVRSQWQRAHLLDTLKPVTHVVLTPYLRSEYPSIEVLRGLCPDVFFRSEKQHSYLPLQKELQAMGTALKAQPMGKMNSTTRIIKKIKKMLFRR